MQRKPAAFLDRDGILNLDKGYVHKIEDFEWVDGAKDAVKLLNDSGYHVFLVTNQSGIARGYYTENDVKALHNWVQSQLAENGAHIDHYYYSPYHVDGIIPEFTKASRCRKPGPGMLEKADQEFDIDHSKSFMIGDKETDVGAAEAFGIDGHLFTGGNLYEAIKKILSTNHA